MKWYNIVLSVYVLQHASFQSRCCAVHSKAQYSTIHNPCEKVMVMFSSTNTFLLLVLVFVLGCFFSLFSFHSFHCYFWIRWATQKCIIWLVSDSSRTILGQMVYVLYIHKFDDEARCDSFMTLIRMDVISDTTYLSQELEVKKVFVFLVFLLANNKLVSIINHAGLSVVSFHRPLIRSSSPTEGRLLAG